MTDAGSAYFGGHGYDTAAQDHYSSTAAPNSTGELII